MAEFTFIPDAQTNKIGFVIRTIEKEARKEFILIRQVLYVMLSMYSNDPRCIMINAPPGEGKTYTTKKVADLFPKEDVFKFIGMSEKSLFHKQGKAVIKNEESGEYEPLDQILERIDLDIIEAQQAGDKNRVKALEYERKEVSKCAKNLIDLTGKCIIFLDTPPQNLLNALIPLMSHDEFEVEYAFVDIHNGIKTKSNVIRGWPVIIITQSLDFSNYTRYPELKRRLIIGNPNMDKEKYKAAVELTFDKYSMPDFMYQNKIVSNEEKDQAREIIKGFKERITDICRAVEPGRTNVIIPFIDALKYSKDGDNATDITNTDRLCGWLALLAAVNIEDRPYIHFRKEGHSLLQKIPLATFADLKETLSLKPNVNGVSPYILDWYNDVFLSFDHNNGSFLTTRELADKTKQITGKIISVRRIRETYLTQLVNEGYIDSQKSDKDHRQDVYYPVLTSIQMNGTQMGEKENTYIFAQSPNFPTQTAIRSSILASLDNATAKGNLANNNYIANDIDNIITKYYNNPEELFKIVEEENNKSQKSGLPLYYASEPDSLAKAAKGAQKKEIDEKRMHSPNLLSGGRETCMECGKRFTDLLEKLDHLKNAHGEIYHD